MFQTKLRIENQNVSFVYDLPDDFPETKLKLKFNTVPVKEMPGDVTFKVYFLFDVSEYYWF